MDAAVAGAATARSTSHCAVAPAILDTTNTSSNSAFLPNCDPIGNLRLSEGGPGAFRGWVAAA